MRNTVETTRHCANNHSEEYIFGYGLKDEHKLNTGQIHQSRVKIVFFGQQLKWVSVCERDAVPLTVMTIIMSAETTSAPEECLAPLRANTLDQHCNFMQTCVSSVCQMEALEMCEVKRETLLKRVLVKEGFLMKFRVALHLALSDGKVFKNISGTRQD